MDLEEEITSEEVKSKLEASYHFFSLSVAPVDHHSIKTFSGISLRLLK